jgi:hypothetical protein
MSCGMCYDGSDRLTSMFSMRDMFMRALHAKKPDTYPPVWPVDISKKESQRLCRDLARSGVEEVFEALVHFKNAKSHRDSVVSEFDRDAVVEEMVDAFNYFLSMLILMGVTEEEFYEMFRKKDAIIHERLTNGY